MTTARLSPQLPTQGESPVRLIATDVDGTILSYTQSRTGALSARTVEAFRMAQEAGVIVVLVTGRPVRGLRKLCSDLGQLGPVIASNGAVTYDLTADRALAAQPLTARTVFEVKDLIAEFDPSSTFAAETLGALHLEETFAKGSMWFDQEHRRAAGIGDDELRLGPLDETLRLDEALSREAGEPQLGDQGVLKLLAKTHAMSSDEFIAAAQERIGDMATVTHSAPGVSLLEISSKGVNKAQALSRFADSLGISAAETIAFGDMPNDVEMLQWAGTSWAVGSAPAMVRSAADRVAGDCDQDGVAEVLEQLVNGRLR